MGHDKKFEKFDKNRRKNEIYGNYLVLSDTGAEMFRCLQKKADWYLSRNLAKVVSENPPIVQLTFKPKKEGWNGDSYYLSPKFNRCVQCGKEDLETLTRHHIVPFFYRKFMPLEVKESSPIDIVPLCCEHHADYELKADELKCELSKKYNAPIHNKMSPHKKMIKEVRSIAYLKLNSWDFVPLDKQKTLNEVLFRYFKREDYSREDLVKVTKLVYKGINPEQEHAQIVMSQIEDLQSFVEMWRTHFMECVKPKFMPEGWDLKRNIYRQQ